MFCRNCGNKLNNNDIFCSGCGTKKDFQQNIENNIINNQISQKSVNIEEDKLNNSIIKKINIFRIITGIIYIIVFVAGSYLYYELISETMVLGVLLLGPLFLVCLFYFAMIIFLNLIDFKHNIISNIKSSSIMEIIPCALILFNILPYIFYPQDSEYLKNLFLIIIVLFVLGISIIKLVLIKKLSNYNIDENIKKTNRKRMGIFGISYVILSAIILFISIFIFPNANDSKILKEELDKRYNNYEIIESTHYSNTGGDDYISAVVKINNELYEITVDISGDTNEYYESLTEEIDFSINTNSKVYSSDNNLILMKLNFNNSYTENKTKMLLFIENENNSDFYDSLYQLLEKLNNEYKKGNDYPSFQVFFTNDIDYIKKDDYKLFLLLNQLSWKDSKKTKNLYKELNVNNYFTFDNPYADNNTDRLNNLKQDIQNLKESYEFGMLYDDYVYEKNMGNY